VSGLIEGRRAAHRHVDRRSILPATRGFNILDPLAAGQARQKRWHLILAGQGQHRD